LIEKKGGVYGDFSLFDKNRKFLRYLLSAKSFDQKCFRQARYVFESHYFKNV